MMRDRDRDRGRDRGSIRNRDGERDRDRDRDRTSMAADEPLRFDYGRTVPAIAREYDHGVVSPDLGRHQLNRFDNVDAFERGSMDAPQYGNYMDVPGDRHVDVACYDGPPPYDVLHFPHFVLVPPSPHAPKRSTRDRPPGCRTVFVGGLPDTVTEDMLGQLFGTCGGICTIKLSRKNFAHIRFEHESCIDKAFYYSGWRMRVDDKDDRANTGRLHVDFAEAYEDQYEWERNQRAYERDQRLQQRTEDVLQAQSPPPVVMYSEPEATVLTESLKGEETFSAASKVLVSWLERGSCNQRSAGRFHAMIQCVSTHVRRLVTECQQHQGEFQRLRQMYRDKLDSIMRQMDDIEKVFNAAAKQKAWDHFSKAQRKNINVWKSQAQDAKRTQTENILKERQEDNMEMSDSDRDEAEAPSRKKMKPDLGEVAQLKDEADSLKCQLEAYKNEVELHKQESASVIAKKDMQIKMLQQALQGTQQQVIKAMKEGKLPLHATAEVHSPAAAALDAPADESADLQPEQPCTDDQTTAVDDTSVDHVEPEAIPIDVAAAEWLSASNLPSASQDLIGNQALLIGVLSTYLNVHPFGASVAYIHSYLQHMGLPTKPNEIEDLLSKFPELYKLEVHADGALEEQRWHFIAMHRHQPTASSC